ncbi:DNA starvation/stationary phase protection protein [Bacillus canaveralius]|uniref:DNA starvation/stationary phase protection protein n=1 Tax=Bacillus canaveralius TaxID=1403243 RepID=A0A2N5GP92_9BACI|nr:DNA starvation/stationary phase protection protein [Bacillus canaveralius]PLR87033.1 DNA starvation/stationary phase protection protein [Bacillus sp. V33-4]PLS00614.1 DNA starvation/stationary phase protection protein [Bacillus canaveralius]
MREDDIVSRELRATLTGLDPEYARKLANALNRYLANLHVVYIKLRNFHWNVVGVDFIDFHEKLAELYEEVALEIDRIAERIKMLGFFPLASMREFVCYATLAEVPSAPYDTATIAYAVAHDFAATARYLREVDQFVRETTDEFTIDLIAAALGFLEKHVWFFTAYLETMGYANPKGS